jgi:hypothetical protein
MFNYDKEGFLTASNSFIEEVTGHSKNSTARKATDSRKKRFFN